jgi:ubiquinone/menaquinone biosynthesis C-methylase UbiE
MSKPWEELVDNHDTFTEEQVANLMRNVGVGTDNFGRRRLVQLVAATEWPDDHEVSILDLACGNCVNFEVFEELYPMNFSYLGVDRGSRFLKNAEERYEGYVNFGVQESFVEELPMADNSHDVVILRHVLEHLPEGYEVAIREAWRVAARDLYVVLFEPLTDKPDNIVRHGPDEHGACYYWNTYNKSDFMKFVLSLQPDNLNVQRISTPSAAHDDIIYRLSKAVPDEE